jgi:hypothetical protein
MKPHFNCEQPATIPTCNSQYSSENNNRTPKKARIQSNGNYTSSTNCSGVVTVEIRRIANYNAPQTCTEFQEF